MAKVKKFLKNQWWTVGESNPRPPECDSGALPTELTAHVVYSKKC